MQPLAQRSIFAYLIDAVRSDERVTEQPRWAVVTLVRFRAKQATRIPVYAGG